MHIRRDGALVQQTGGDFADQRCVYQEFVPTAAPDGWRPQFGVWTVGSEPVAIGIRETDDLIITGDSQFVPHVIA